MSADHLHGYCEACEPQRFKSTESFALNQLHLFNHRKMQSTAVNTLFSENAKVK
jgi:hypothetical protein